MSATVISLAKRPVLFALARASRRSVAARRVRATRSSRAPSAKRADESHRARLRVEIGRLRRCCGRWPT
jgi:hypothetical protein